MCAARKAKDAAPPGPDDLVRQQAGNYLSGDGRFEVRQSDSNWYLVDTFQANEFGQDLIHGPFSSLKQAQSAMAGAREVRPLLKSRPRRPPTVSKPKPAPRPESWIDKLPEAEQREVRALIRVLKRQGVPGADELVKLHRADVAPTIATRQIEHLLAALIDSQPEDHREEARELIRRVLEIVAGSGTSVARPAPGWTLVEIPQADKPPSRRITPRV